MSDNAIHTFDKLAEGSKFVFAVVYRGHWCPFCMSYLQSFAALAPAIRSLGGAPVIITAESEKYLEKTRGATQWDGLSIIDANLELVDEMRKRGWVDVKLTKTTKDGYAKGQMAQPAVLVLRHGGEVLESWAVIPSLMTLGGAKDRPMLEQIWQNVQAKMEGKAPVHKSYSFFGFFSLLKSKIFG